MYSDPEYAVEVRIYFGYDENGNRDVRCDAKHADGSVDYNLRLVDVDIDEFTVFHDLRAVNRF